MYWYLFMMYKIKNKEGFTLSEIVIAIAILGLIMVAVSGVFIAGLNSIKKGKGISVGLCIASKKIDEINSVDLWDQLGISKAKLRASIENYEPSSIVDAPTDYVPWDMTGSQNIDGIEEISNVKYNFTISILPFRNNLKKVTVEVYWNDDASNSQKRLELNTFLARKVF